MQKKVTQLADENISRVSCLIDFIGQFSRATKPRLQMSADQKIKEHSPRARALNELVWGKCCY